MINLQASPSNSLKRQFWILLGALCANKCVVLLRRALFISLEILNAYKWREWNREEPHSLLLCWEGLALYLCARSPQRPLFMHVYFSAKFNSAEAEAHTGQPACPCVLVWEAPLLVFFALFCASGQFRMRPIYKGTRGRYSPLWQLLFPLSPFLFQSMLCVVQRDILIQLSSWFASCEISWRRRRENFSRRHMPPAALVCCRQDECTHT